MLVVEWLRCVDGWILGFVLSSWKLFSLLFFPLCGCDSAEVIVSAKTIHAKNEKTMANGTPACWHAKCYPEAPPGVVSAMCVPRTSCISIEIWLRMFGTKKKFTLEKPRYHYYHELVTKRKTGPVSLPSSWIIKIIITMNHHGNKPVCSKRYCQVHILKKKQKYCADFGFIWLGWKNCVRSLGF